MRPTPRLVLSGSRAARGDAVRSSPPTPGCLRISRPGRCGRPPAATCTSPPPVLQVAGSRLPPARRPRPIFPTAPCTSKSSAGSPKPCISRPACPPWTSPSPVRPRPIWRPISFASSSARTAARDCNAPCARCSRHGRADPSESPWATTSRGVARSASSTSAARRSSWPTPRARRCPSRAAIQVVPLSTDSYKIAVVISSPDPPKRREPSAVMLSTAAVGA
jgi:hypothetical protein